MQVAKINSLSANSYTQQNNIRKQNKPQATENNNARDLSFEGANFKRYGKLFLNARDLQDEEFFFKDINDFLSISREALKPYFRLDRKDRTDFFYDLADALSKDLRRRKVHQSPEKSLETLDGLYQTVLKPHRTQQSIVQHPYFTFEEKEQLLTLTANGGTNEELFNKLRHLGTITNSSNNIDWKAEEYIDILTSPYAEKLNENFLTFKNYIRINCEAPGFIENLEKELERETPSFDPILLQRQVLLSEFNFSSAIIRHLPQEELFNNWNPEGLDLMSYGYLHSFQQYYKGDIYDQDNINFYRYLFNTTTEENLDMRKLLFKRSYTKAQGQDTNSTIINFIERLEADENIQTIYDTANKKGSRLVSHSFNELLFYADTFGADVIVKKLDKFFEIIDTTIAKPDEMVQILRKNFNNPYYLSERSLSHLREDEIDIRNSNFFFPETKAQLHRFRRKFTYNFLPKIFGTGKETPVKMETSYQAYSDAIANTPLKGFVARIDERVQNANVIIVPSEGTGIQGALPAPTSTINRLENAFDDVIEATPIIEEEEKARPSQIIEILEMLKSSAAAKEAEKPAAAPIQLLSLSEIIKRNSASPFFDMSKVELAPVKKPTRGPITDPARLLMAPPAPVQAEEKAKPSQILEILNMLETSAKAKEAAKPVIKRDYKAEYQARKLRIQKEAQEIIKTRMKSAKQIEEQIGVYTKNATKMRNQFLNEMFNSVAETRAQQRATGIKRPNISNQDVIDTYLKINGKNKKIFKEMLKARTETGERKYNLKEIAKVLEAENQKNLEIKKANALRRKEERARLKALSLNN